MPNFSFEFEISRVDDRQIADTVARAVEAIPWTLTQATFTFPFGGGSLLCTAEELSSHGELNEILNSRLDIVGNFIYKFAGGGKLAIVRADQRERGDKITLNSGQHDTPAQFAKIVAGVRRHFDGLPPDRFVDSLTSQSSEQQSEAREAALTRLEATAAHLLTESEQARKRWEAEYRQKEKDLAKEFQQRTEQFHRAAQEREDQLRAWDEELRQREQQLTARTGRHQVPDHLKSKLADLDRTLRLSRATRWTRRVVSGLAVVLLILFGAGAGYHLFRILALTDPTSLIVTGLNQALFTVLFLATLVFFVRWQAQWFRRRAAEEFRFKRYAVEVDRASWLLDAAFQWKEQFAAEMPVELLARLAGRRLNGFPREPSATDDGQKTYDKPIARPK